MEEILSKTISELNSKSKRNFVSSCNLLIFGQLPFIANMYTSSSLLFCGSKCYSEKSYFGITSNFYSVWISYSEPSQCICEFIRLQAAWACRASTGTARRASSTAWSWTSSALRGDSNDPKSGLASSNLFCQIWQQFFISFHFDF